MIVRTVPDPLTLAASVCQEVAAVDPTIPVLALQSVRQGLTQSMETPRFTTMLLMGLLRSHCCSRRSVLTGDLYAVSQRRQEIGIRMALGAAPAKVLRAIVGQGLTLALLGVGLGFAGAFVPVTLIPISCTAFAPVIRSPLLSWGAGSSSSGPWPATCRPPRRRRRSGGGAALRVALAKSERASITSIDAVLPSPHADISGQKLCARRLTHVTSGFQIRPGADEQRQHPQSRE